jgi:hypothetical protein
MIQKITMLIESPSLLMAESGEKRTSAATIPSPMMYLIGSLKNARIFTRSSSRGSGIYDRRSENFSLPVIIAESEFGDIGNIEMPLCQQTRETCKKRG